MLQEDSLTYLWLLPNVHEELKDNKTEWGEPWMKDLSKWMKALG
jgi:hypothetical protein